VGKDALLDSEETVSLVGVPCIVVIVRGVSNPIFRGQMSPEGEEVKRRSNRIARAYNKLRELEEAVEQHQIFMEY